LLVYIDYFVRKFILNDWNVLIDLPLTLVQSFLTIYIANVMVYFALLTELKH